MRFRHGMGFAFAVVLLLEAMGPATATPGDPFSGCGTGWTKYDLPDQENALNILSMSASSPTNVWAVGVGGFTSAPLIERWDGRSWTAPPSPVVGQAYGVAAVSSSAVWIAGITSTGYPLIDRWDGYSLSSVAQTAHRGLYGIDASSSVDVWAVGYWQAGALVDHWDGTSWSELTAPGVPVLQAVSAPASDDVWALGIGVVLHWDGAVWSATDLHTRELNAIKAFGPNDVWVVGGGSEDSEALVYHWDGTSWSVVPQPPLQGTALNAVSGPAPDDLWAVGNQVVPYGHLTVVVEHWDGRSWLQVPSPFVYPSVDWVANAITALGDDRVWAAPETYVSPGNYYIPSLAALCLIRVTDGGSVPRSTIIGIPTPEVWMVDPHSQGAHSVTDGSGMALFDSGLLQPGESYSYTFQMAGTFPIVDSATGLQSSVVVRLYAPLYGRIGYSIPVVWAFEPPGDLVFDAQYRLGHNPWKTWRQYRGTKEVQGAFDPDYPGLYCFRARSRRGDQGSSGWSPQRCVTVTA
jgi:hypothetical protein